MKYIEATLYKRHFFFSCKHFRKFFPRFFPDTCFLNFFPNRLSRCLSCFDQDAQLLVAQFSGQPANWLLPVQWKRRRPSLWKRAARNFWDAFDASNELSKLYISSWGFLFAAPFDLAEAHRSPSARSRGNLLFLSPLTSRWRRRLKEGARTKNSRGKSKSEGRLSLCVWHERAYSTASREKKMRAPERKER